jgi:hypothetical protein
MADPLLEIKIPGQSGIVCPNVWTSFMSLRTEFSMMLTVGAQRELIAFSSWTSAWQVHGCTLGSLCLQIRIERTVRTV